MSNKINQTINNKPSKRKITSQKEIIRIMDKKANNIQKSNVYNGK